MAVLEWIRLRQARPKRADIIIGAVGAAGIIVAISVLAALLDTFPGDERVVEMFQGYRRPWLDATSRAASSVADIEVVVISILLATVLLWLMRRRADSVVMLLLFVPEGINVLLKELVGRPRPDFTMDVSPLTNYSFPSGHALHSMLFFGLIMLLAADAIKNPRLRIVVQGVLGITILVCGISRVYLGAHWPSDVLGGFLVGVISLTGVYRVRKMLINRGLQ